MKILLAILLNGMFAYAGTVKLTWDTNSNDIFGNPVKLSKFSIYWGVSQTGLENVIELGPPAPQPWRINPDGSGRYSRTLVDATWEPGFRYCFSVSAWVNSFESDHSNVKCVVMTANPEAPNLVDITEMP